MPISNLKFRKSVTNVLHVYLSKIENNYNVVNTNQKFKFKWRPLSINVDTGNAKNCPSCHKWDYGNISEKLSYCLYIY